MRNLLFRISYNGANYHGYQVQANAVSVAQVLQDAIEKVIKVRERIVGCSRTDAKVHANCYYFNMKTACSIPADRFVTALNCVLPDDIAVHSCQEVPLSFHARYNCTSKEYIYKIWNSPVKQPFLQNLALHYRYPLDAVHMDCACKEFIGTYDFKAFCAAGGKDMDTVRTICDCQVTREGDLVQFRVLGNGFLYNMVRIMVGTLLEVEEQHLAPSEIKQIILSKERHRAGRTARPEGLYLNRVNYGGDCFE